MPNELEIEELQFSFKNVFWEVVWFVIFILEMVSFFYIFLFEFKYIDIDDSKILCGLSIVALSAVIYYFFYKKNNLGKIYFLIFLFFIMINFYLYISKENDFFYLLEIYTFIIMIIPLFIIVFSKKSLPLLFHWLFRYRFYNVENSNLYTTNYDYEHKIKNIKNADVIFLLNDVSTKYNKNKNDKNFNNIKEHFAELIYFWYAYTFNRVYLRFILPILSIVMSIVFFSFVIYTLDVMKIDDNYHNNVVKMILVVIFLTVQYLSMLYHVNNILDPRFYIQELNKEFKNSQIHFKDIKNSQKVLLYLDNTFLINIYDRKYDRVINLNKSEKFRRFITKGKLDKEGRDNIANIFVSLLVVVYIEIFVQVIPSASNSKIRLNSDIKVNNEVNMTIVNKSKIVTKKADNNVTK